MQWRGEPQHAWDGGVTWLSIGCITVIIPGRPPSNPPLPLSAPRSLMILFTSLGIVTASIYYYAALTGALIITFAIMQQLYLPAATVLKRWAGETASQVSGWVRGSLVVFWGILVESRLFVAAPHKPLYGSHTWQAWNAERAWLTDSSLSPPVPACCPAAKVYVHVDESLHGMDVIKAFRASDYFIQVHISQLCFALG